MSTTDQMAAALATPLAYAEDVEQMDLPMGVYAEDAKALGQPIGVYGEGKYGECRTPTTRELAANGVRPDKTEA